jgi:hypothetical protein
MIKALPKNLKKMVEALNKEDVDMPLSHSFFFDDQMSDHSNLPNKIYEAASKGNPVWYCYVEPREYYFFGNAEKIEVALENTVKKLKAKGNGK